MATIKDLKFDDKNFNKNHKDITNNIYFNDEMDFCIISDYTSCYELNEDDKKFIKLLGFEVEDFIGEEDGK